MPAVSEKQERLMRAVAHNPEFAKKVGIPQSVGKEFTDAEMDTWLNELVLGEILKADNTEDIPAKPTLLSTPDDCEAPVDCDIKPDEHPDESEDIKLIEKMVDPNCIKKDDHPDEPEDIDLIEKMVKPNCIKEDALGVETETDIAEAMSKGLLPSPQLYANVMLLAIRITGTGLAFRSAIGEHVWRDPELYLNDEFLKRCNGLMVIMDHPDSAVLNTEEFKNRAVGSIMLPYIKGDEVWGIAKIYDQPAVTEICEGEISTSPSVVFDNTAGNTTLTTENGQPLLIEGVPFLLDHIAIVTKARGSKGVWDKGGDATGVLLNNQEVSDMTENKLEPKADANGDVLADILQAVKGLNTNINSLSARMDSMEKDLPAPPLVSAADKKSKKDEDDRMDDDDEEESKKDDDSEAKAKKFIMRKAKKDAEGKIEMPAGEMKFDAAEEEEAKSDEDLEEEAKKADEDEASMADAQAKADSVYAAFGKSASRPLKGENLMSYRKRMARGLQAHSDAYKEVNLSAIKDAMLLNIAEKQIYADALVAAKSPTMYAADQEIELHEKDRAGRMISKFKGGFGWMDAFKVPAMRVKEFNLNNNKR